MFGLGDNKRRIARLEYDLKCAKDELRDAQHERRVCLRKYNDLVELINQKGGWDFLNSNLADNTRSERMGRYGNPTKQFTSEEIKIIRILCHPDKHGNGSHGKKASEIFIKTSNM